jgi:hypothetical protein
MVSRHISTVIAASREAVYDFARDPANLPRWASGLADGEVTSEDDGGLVVDSPMGRVAVRFAPHNEYGVLDHDVTLPTGDVTTNPLRVLAHPDGAEVVFTVRQGTASDEDLDRDAATIAKDLATLKALIEG